MAQETTEKHYNNHPDILNPKNYIGQAINFLKNRDDAEDAVQSALLYWLLKKDHPKWKINPTMSICWLVKVQCIDILRKRNHIIVGGNRKGGYSKVEYGQDAYINDYPEYLLDVILYHNRAYSTNDGPFNHDLEVHTKNTQELKEYKDRLYCEKVSSVSLQVKDNRKKYINVSTKESTTRTYLKKKK